MSKIGKATIEPLGSFQNREVLSQLVAYRRVVAANYVLTGPDEIQHRLGMPLLVSTKIDGELWFALHDGEWKLVSPTGRVISGDLEILQEVAKSGVATDTILAGELYVKVDGRARIADVSSALGGGGMANTSTLAFAVFDVVSSADISAIGTPYSARHEFINKIPLGQQLHPIHNTATKSSSEVTELFEKEVGAKGAEGLVARSEDGRTFKVKPSKELDAAILGFTERRDADGSTSIRSLLFGLLQDDGSWIPIATTGNVGDAAFRKELYLQLEKTVRPSSYRRISESSGVMYKLVEPTAVVELRCLDFQLEDIQGRLIKNPRLVHDSKSWQVSGWTNSVVVHNSVVVRLRPDKGISVEDIGWTQITRQLPIAEVTEAVVLGKSEVIRRAVWTKEGAGKTDVRKLLVWKTNKETAGYPAYVVHWTDYSSTRSHRLIAKFD